MLELVDGRLYLLTASPTVTVTVASGLHDIDPRHLNRM